MYHRRRGPRWPQRGDGGIYWACGSSRRRRLSSTEIIKPLPRLLHRGRSYWSKSRRSASRSSASLTSPRNPRSPRRHQLRRLLLHNSTRCRGAAHDLVVAHAAAPAPAPLLAPDLRYRIASSPSDPSFQTSMYDPVDILDGSTLLYRQMFNSVSGLRLSTEMDCVLLFHGSCVCSYGLAPCIQNVWMSGIAPTCFCQSVIL